MRHWTVACDFDGTISREDVTDSLLRRFARPGWEALEHEWLEGRIGSRECMAGQIGLLDCSREELDAHIATLAIDPDFAAFGRAVARREAPLAIVSDGLDHVIRAMLKGAGIGGVPVLASHLVQVDTRRWALAFPHAEGECRSATCKCSCSRAGLQQSLLLVGDGASDFCVAERATLTFARGRLLEHCRAARLPHRAVADFAQATLAWELLADADRESATNAATDATEPASTHLTHAAHAPC